MKYLVGEDWMKLFDVVITHARKPKFFHDENRYFSATSFTKNFHFLLHHLFKELIRLINVCICDATFVIRVLRVLTATSFKIVSSFY